MGENGAGKSTLMKIVAGMYQADGGEIRWRGEKVRFTRPAEAAAHGIAMVHQESLLAPHLTVAENIFLGRAPEFGLRLGQPPRDRAPRAPPDRGAQVPARGRTGGWRSSARPRSSWSRSAAPSCTDRACSSSTSRRRRCPTSETHEVFRIVGTLRERGWA